MSQAEFANKIGINPNTLRNYEQGQSLPNVATIAELANKLGISVEWLVLGIGKKRRAGEDAISEAEAPRQQTSTACSRCEKLEGELEKERVLNRELVAENRQLWRENGDLRVELAEIKARAAPDNATPEDAQNCA
jgi:transcriptional regulator with XRE-family HTH domain